jgi:hypothetical protein
MKYYQSKCTCISGDNYADKERKARQVYNEIAAKTKRMPYVRSAYFKREKVFLKLFWNHLAQKRLADRSRRIIYYRPAIDLIRNSRVAPEITNLDMSREVYYRFYGRTADGKEFIVQIKQNKSGGKYHMSVFPPRHQK